MPMLIDNVQPRVPYIATAGQTQFSVPFVFFTDSELAVYVNGTLQTLTTHYTCTGAGSDDDATRKITFTSGRALNDAVVIVRVIPIERITDFPLSGPLNIDSLNTELDKLFAIAQRLDELIKRTIRLAESDGTYITQVIPNAATRADKLIGFDNSGNLTVTASVAGIDGSVTAAAGSATAASTSASAAAASAALAAASYDSFDDRYLGPKNSDPTTDNDGNTLADGALYWNTPTGIMRGWNGTAWVNVAATVTSITAAQISDSTAGGRALITAATAAAARGVLGSTATGDALFTATDAAAGRTALGATTVGANVFTAADAAAGRAALGIGATLDWYSYANYR